MAENRIGKVPFGPLIAKPNKYRVIGWRPCPVLSGIFNAKLEFMINLMYQHDLQQFSTLHRTATPDIRKPMSQNVPYLNLRDLFPVFDHKTF